MNIGSSIGLDLESVVNAISMGLILVDRNERVLLWNEWIVRHSGISAQQATGKLIDEVFHETPTPAFLSALRSTLQYGLPAVMSNALHRSPLPLYPMSDARLEQQRMHQSITITSMATPDMQRYGLIQVSDSSNAIRREKMLRSHSEILKREATTDSLTGIYNRRFFDEHYKMALGQSIRQKQPISVFMIDVDYFKEYNDYYGHMAGDKTLSNVANTIKNMLARSSDVVARYGGEEFILMLPNTNADHAIQFAEKLRQAIWHLAIPHVSSKIAAQLSVSIGVSTFEHANCGNERSLILAADTALYEAKRNGRNQVRAMSLSAFLSQEKTTVSSPELASTV